MVPPSFNPWYVGGGVKRQIAVDRICYAYRVSILGMLEGVLKVGPAVSAAEDSYAFQSLVCWRGC